MKKTAFTGALIIALSSFASIEASAAEDSLYIDTLQAIIDADSTLKIAAKQQGEWRDSMKLLQQAKAAAEKGYMPIAMKLAKKAKFQGEMGLAQARDQKNIQPWAF